MPFPIGKRAVYRKNTLTEVQATLRFHPILKIDSEPPVKIQDAIRNRYPLFKLEVVGQSVPIALPPQMQAMMHGMPGVSGQVQYTFASTDGCWRVVLLRDTLVLTTKKYETWDDFRSRLAEVRGVFDQYYSPGVYTDLHLRYINLIQRSRLGLAERHWRDLLNPHIAGELAFADIASDVDKLKRELHCKLDQECSFLWLRTAFATVKNSDPTERCFVIDNDFHTHALTEPADAERIFNRFNGYSRDVFQWAIRPELHRAMEPEQSD
jgi:uncharacterized protein (TIGR04255 family)